MRPILLNRKSMTWSVYLDMPIGFVPATNAQAVNEVVFGEPGLCHTGPFQPGEAQAWLVVLGVANSGIMPVSDENFRVPLAFRFPGREVRRAQISPEPTARADVSGTGRVVQQARVRLRGLRLKRNDELTLTVILTGRPPCSASAPSGAKTNRKHVSAQTRRAVARSSLPLTRFEHPG